MDKIIELLSKYSSAPQWWWFLFLVVSAIVIGFAKIAVNLLEAIAERTKIASAFIGGVMLALVTSLPELMSAIFSGSQHHPTTGFSNALGTNMLMAAGLGIIDLVIIKKLIFKDIDKGNKALIYIMIFINLGLLIGLILPGESWKTLPGTHTSWILLLPLITYVVYVVWSWRWGGKHEDDVQIKQLQSKSNLSHDSLKAPYSSFKVWQIWLMFISASALLIFFGYNNTSIVEKFSDENGVEGVYHIPKTTGAGFFLSLATTLPEFTSLIILTRKGLTNIAVGGVIGASIFNLATLAVTDLIDQNQVSLIAIQNEQSKHGHDQYTAWLSGAVAVSLILAMNITSWRWKKIGKKIKIPVIMTKHYQKRHKVEPLLKIKYSLKYYRVESILLIGAYILTYVLTTFVFGP